MTAAEPSEERKVRTMSGPCMCGDIYCHSCGPAQGNHKCPVCGVRSYDGECVDPAACEKAEREMEDAMVRDLEEADRVARAYWAAFGKKGDETDV